MYLSQFDLNIRHKTERDHVIPNVLSRFSCFDEEKFTKNENDDILNDVETYVETLMKMFIIFKERLIQIYKTNRKWSTLYELCYENFRFSFVSFETSFFLNFSERKKKNETFRNIN